MSIIADQLDQQRRTPVKPVSGIDWLKQNGPDRFKKTPADPMKATTPATPIKPPAMPKTGTGVDWLKQNGPERTALPATAATPASPIKPPLTVTTPTTATTDKRPGMLTGDSDYWTQADENALMDGADATGMSASQQAARKAFQTERSRASAAADAAANPPEPISGKDLRHRVKEIRKAIRY
jgi:hypothetical protein